MTPLQKTTIEKFTRNKNLLVDNEGKPTETSIQRAARVGDYLYEELNKQGEFFIYQTYIYYFHRATREAYPVGDSWSVLRNPFARFLKGWMWIEIGKPSTAQYLDHLYAKICEHAEAKTIYKFVHYDEKKNVLYVRKSKTEWYKLTTKEIKIIGNGEDGVIGWGEFDDSGVEIKDLISDKRTLAQFFNKFWFKTDEEKALCKLWTYSLFFPELLHTKPILVLWGDTGSGKTTVAQMLGRMLFGDNFSVKPVTDSAQDFMTNTYHNHLLCYDNVDGELPAGLADKIAGVVTGMGIEVRKLYHNPGDEPHKLKPNCYFMITTRTPEFNRDDIVNRSVVLELERTGEYINAPFAGLDRFQFWQHILPELQQMLTNIKANSATSIATNYRIVEFINFCYKASHKSSHKILERVLGFIKGQQEMLVLDNKPILDLLAELVEQFPFNTFYATSNLFDRFGAKLGIRSAKAFGRLLQSERTIIKSVFYFEAARISIARGYFIGPKNGTKPVGIDLIGSTDNSEAVEAALGKGNPALDLGDD